MNLIVWDEGPIAIRDVTRDEAPSACRVQPTASGSAAYDIRTFDGTFWWPVFDGWEPLSVHAFKDSAPDSNGYFLATMNLSPATLYSSRDVDTESFYSDISVKRIISTSKKERRNLASISALKTLFCDGMVYRKGGRPAYFGTVDDKTRPPTVTFEVGDLRLRGNSAGDRWHSRLKANTRQRAAQRSLVFDVMDVENASHTLDLHGFQTVIKSTITSSVDSVRTPDVSQYCADAIAKKILGTGATLSFLSHASLSFAADQLISWDLCREIIAETLAVCSPEEIRDRFSVEPEWLSKAIERLDSRIPSPPLSPEDETAICLLALI